MARHRGLSLWDQVRGWHWEGGRKIRNWCGCEISVLPADRRLRVTGTHRAA